MFLKLIFTANKKDSKKKLGKVSLFAPPYVNRISQKNLISSLTSPSSFMQFSTLGCNPSSPPTVVPGVVLPARLASLTASLSSASGSHQLTGGKADQNIEIMFWGGVILALATVQAGQVMSTKKVKAESVVETRTYSLMAIIPYPLLCDMMEYADPFNGHHMPGFRGYCGMLDIYL